MFTVQISLTLKPLPLALMQPAHRGTSGLVFFFSVFFLLLYCFRERFGPRSRFFHYIIIIIITTLRVCTSERNQFVKLENLPTITNSRPPSPPSLVSAALDKHNNNNNYNTTVAYISYVHVSYIII